MKKELDSILDKEIEKIKIDEKTFDEINKMGLEFISDLRSRIKKKNIKAEVFVGGSLAKNTMIKKDSNDLYDIDVFVRFDKKYPENKLSEFLLKLMDKCN